MPAGVVRRGVACLAVALVAAMPCAVEAQDRDPCLDNIRPVAYAGPDQTVAAGTTVQFDAGVEAGLSYDPEGRDLNYFIWYFGDGQVGRGAVVSHTYHQVGTFAVRLTVTDDCRTRGSDTAIIMVTIGDPGNGDPCDSNMAPVARLSGTVSAEVDTTILFRGHTSSDADGEITSHEWDFGDGTSATGSVVGHAFDSPGVYSVSLTVTDNCGATDVERMTVTITQVVDPCANNAAPTANPGGSRSAESGESVLFSAAFSSDQDGEITSYLWNFGDGSSALGRNVAHTYSRAGTFYVVLTVTDNCGASASRTIVVWVSNADPCAGNLAPTANAGADAAVRVGEQARFDGSRSSDPDLQDQLTFSWNFGDGSSSNQVNPSHVFAAAGTFNVTLTVRDECGAQDGDAVVITVLEQENVDTLTLEATPTSVRAMEAVSFNAATPADLYGRVYYRWEFGDGSYPGYGNSTAEHTYSDPGTYHVTVTLIDKISWQVVDSASKPVVVTERLTVAGFLSGSLANNNDIAVVGDSVFVCGSPNLVVLADTSNEEAPRLVDVMSTYGSPTSAATNGILVAVAASYGGVLLFDGGNANAIEQVGRIDTYSDGAFRAFGVAFDGTTLFVTGEWGGLRVYDVANASAPRLIAGDSDAGFLRVIEVYGGRAYVLDASIPGVRILNVADRSNPTEIGRVVTGNEPLRMDVASTEVGLLLAVTQGNAGVEFFEVSNPAAPRFLSEALTVNGVGGVVLQGTTAYVGHMSAVVELDVSEPSDPREMAFVPLETGLPTGQILISNGQIYAGFKGGVVAVLRP